jgi:hypothetical protein
MTAQNAFMMQEMNKSWTYLQNGSMHSSFLVVMEANFGAFFYVMFFGTPFVMIWIKSKDIGLAMISVLWTMFLYGLNFPGTIASDNVTALFIVGLAVTLFKAWSVVR